MLRKAWSPHGVEVKYMIVPDSHHFQAYEALADRDSGMFNAAKSLVISGK